MYLLLFFCVFPVYIAALVRPVINTLAPAAIDTTVRWRHRVVVSVPCWIHVVATRYCTLDTYCFVATASWIHVYVRVGIRLTDSVYMFLYSSAVVTCYGVSRNGMSALGGYGSDERIEIFCNSFRCSVWPTAVSATHDTTPHRVIRQAVVPFCCFFSSLLFCCYAASMLGCFASCAFAKALNWGRSFVVIPF